MTSHLRRRLSDVRGSVLVLVAVGMFPILGMLAFAIDIPHWFDYSRSLQNRADAAALAGGVAYGGICFATPGDTTNGAQSEIGKWAQVYSGAFKNEPAGNLPYTDAAVLGTGAPPNVRPANYLNPTNLQAGTAANYFVRFNANNYADKGGTNFFMGDFCNADPTKDATDHDPGTPAAMVDVKVSQVSVPNFIKIFNVQPTLHAHARVELRNVQSSADTRPIAVPDPAQIPCWWPASTTRTRTRS